MIVAIYALRLAVFATGLSYRGASTARNRAYSHARFEVTESSHGTREIESVWPPMMRRSLNVSPETCLRRCQIRSRSPQPTLNFALASPTTEFARKSIGLKLNR